MAATTKLDIDADNDKLRELVADLTEAVNDARKEVTAEVRVPVSGLGRLKDVFDKLARTTTEKMTSFSRSEMEREKTRAADELSSQKTNMEADFNLKMTGKVNELTTKYETHIAELEARETETRKLYMHLKNRSENSEKILEAIEAEKQKADDRAAEAMGAIAKGEDALLKSKEVWAQSVADILQACTLKAHWEEEEHDASKPWRAKQRSAAEIIQKDMDKVSARTEQSHAFWNPGEQLKHMCKVYEEAKLAKEGERTRERREADEEAARQKRASDEDKAALRDEISQKEKALKEAKHHHDQVMKDVATREQKLQQELRDASKIAKNEAGAEAKRLKGELTEVTDQLTTCRTSLEEAQKELTTTCQELETQTTARGVAEGQARTIVASHKAQMAGLWAMLQDAQSAGCHGGYYFAAAASPTKRSSRSPIRSPPLFSLGSPPSSPRGASPTQGAYSPSASRQSRDHVEGMQTGDASDGGLNGVRGSPPIPTGLNARAHPPSTTEDRQRSGKSGQRSSQRVVKKLARDSPKGNSSSRISPAPIRGAEQTSQRGGGSNRSDR